MPVDYSALSQKIELAVTLAKEVATELSSSVAKDAQIAKLSSDLATAQQDLDTANTQVTTLTARLAEATDALQAALPLTASVTPAA